MARCLVPGGKVEVLPEALQAIRGTLRLICGDDCEGCSYNHIHQLIGMKKGEVLGEP